MFQRHKLEKEEGKLYNEAGVQILLIIREHTFNTHSTSQVSADMKALNRRFGMLHGISSLANLAAVIALGFHGVWIGNMGVQGY